MVPDVEPQVQTSTSCPADLLESAVGCCTENERVTIMTESGVIVAEIDSSFVLSGWNARAHIHIRVLTHTHTHIHFLSLTSHVHYYLVY